MQLPKINHVKLPKQNDVKNLLKYFSIPEDAQQFYEDIFKNSEDVGNEEQENLYDEDNDWDILLYFFIHNNILLLLFKSESVP